MKGVAGGWIYWLLV